MRAVVQRVLKAEVKIGDKSIGRINKGLLIYLSVGKDDTLTDAGFIADKIVNLRIFADEAGKMNRSVLDIGGDILLVSNFTLHGDCRKGRRPSFDAAPKELAQQLYDKVGDLISAQGIAIEKGAFGEYMHVGSINDGPVNFLLDSKHEF